MEIHQFILYKYFIISQTYIDKRISMFIYLTWKKNGKELKTLLEFEKALKMAEKLQPMGVEPKLHYDSKIA